MASSRSKFLSWLPWLLILVGVFAFWKWQSVSQPVNYDVETITRGTLEDAVTATGSLQASQYVDIGVQVSGILQKLYVQMGQNVHKKDLLAQIDPTLFQATVDEDEATLKSLQAQLVASQASLKLAGERNTRNENLMKHHAVSQDDLDNSEANFARAKSAVDSLKAQIENAKGGLDAAHANLSYTKIYAPISGTVVQIQAREGQTLNASQTAPILFRLANLHTMTVDALVSEADIPHVHAGMPVYFTTLGDPDTHHDAKVRVIEPSSVSTNPPIFYDTLFDVTNDNLSLMPEMTAQVFFPILSRTNVLVMPLAALDYDRLQHPGSRPKIITSKGDKPHPTKVFVLRNEKPVEVEVNLGMKNRVSAEVLSGLSEGDEVITGPMDSGATSRPSVKIH